MGEAKAWRGMDDGWLGWGGCGVDYLACGMWCRSEGWMTGQPKTARSVRGFVRVPFCWYERGKWGVIAVGELLWGALVKFITVEVCIITLGCRTYDSILSSPSWRVLLPAQYRANTTGTP